MGGPFSLHLETAAVCNLKCPECAAGRGVTKRHQKYMEPDLVEKLLAAHQKNAFYCNLYFQGEPFLHPDIFKILQKASSRNYYTVISTNGHFLDEANCIQTVESKLNRLVVSLDGTRQQTYWEYRRGGKFDTVIKGIRQLVETRNRLGKTNPLIVVQFLVNKTNEHELPGLTTFVRNLGVDVLVLKSMQIYSDAGKKTFTPSIQQYNRYPKNPSPKSKSCFRLWSNAVYTSDGQMVPCCYDKIPEYPMGEGEVRPLTHWKSKTMQDFRKRILENKNLHEICSNCGR